MLLTLDSGLVTLSLDELTQRLRIRNIPVVARILCYTHAALFFDVQAGGFALSRASCITA
jgi:hypothetical protein